MSGIFYRLYEKERAGILIDIDEEVMEIIQERIAVGKINISEDRPIGVVLSEYKHFFLKDYHRWKCAFFV